MFKFGAVIASGLAFTVNGDAAKTIIDAKAEKEAEPRPDAKAEDRHWKGKGLHVFQNFIKTKIESLEIDFEGM